MPARIVMPELSAQDRAEADLAREMRALGAPRERAAALAEAHGERIVIHPDGGVSITLPDGPTLYGEPAIRALAADILREM